MTGRVFFRLQLRLINHAFSAFFCTVFMPNLVIVFGYSCTHTKHMIKVYFILSGKLIFHNNSKKCKLKRWLETNIPCLEKSHKIGFSNNLRQGFPTILNSCNHNWYWNACTTSLFFLKKHTSQITYQLCPDNNNNNSNSFI